MDYLRRGYYQRSKLCESYTKHSGTLKERRRVKLNRHVLFDRANATAHNNLVSMAAIHNGAFEIKEQPPCFPGLAPHDYNLAHKLKKHL